jgi:hypothetical protein
MKQWWTKFWDENGQRIVYMTAAAGYSFLFIAMATFDWPEKLDGDWLGAAKTILIGLAMLCYNKARGNGVSKKEETK